MLPSVFAADVARCRTARRASSGSASPEKPTVNLSVVTAEAHDLQSEDQVVTAEVAAVTMSESKQEVEQGCVNDSPAAEAEGLAD